MAKKTKQLGLDGNQAEGGDDPEEPSPDEDEEEETPEPTEEELAATKKKEEEIAEMRKTIEAEMTAKIAKEKAAKELAAADEKEKVPDAVKEYADVLRTQLGETYPEAFNKLKIRARTIAMLGLITMKDKLAATAPTPKGKSTIPKPSTKSTKVKSKFNAVNSYKEKAKKFPWKQEY